MKPRRPVGTDVDVEAIQGQYRFGHPQAALIDDPQPQPVPRILWLATVLLLALSCTASATTAVVVRDVDEVWIGVDTRITDQVRHSEIFECKVHPLSPRVAWVATGIYRWGDEDDPAFDAEPLIRDVFSPDLPLGVIASRAIWTMASAFREAVLTANPHLLKPFGDDGLSVVIVGFGPDSTEAEWHSLDLWWWSPGVSVSVDACARGCGPAQMSMGDGREAEGAALSDPNFFRQYPSPKEAIASLVRIGVESCPKTCGGPIDVIRVTRQGTQWLERSEYCARGKQAMPAR